MKIIEKAVTPNGVEIQLEDWREEYDEINIGAYPIAQRTSSVWIKGGDKFRLTISQNHYTGYSAKDVKQDFEALKNGEKTLEDLSEHFQNGEKDMFTLGMNV